MVVGFYCCLLYAISCVVIIVNFPKKKMLVNFCNEGQAAQSILLVFKSVLKLMIILECRLTECYCWVWLLDIMYAIPTYLLIMMYIYNIHLSSFNVV